MKMRQTQKTQALYIARLYVKAIACWSLLAEVHYLL